MRPYYSDDAVTIYHADCLDILPQVVGCGAVVSDPPYSSGGMFRGDRVAKTLAKYVNSDTMDKPPEFSGDNRDQRSFLAWCALWMTASRNACGVGSPIAVFSDWRQLPTTTDAIQCGGWVWRGIATWHKPGIRMQRGAFSGSSEFVVWGTNGPKIDHDGYAQNVIACAPVDDKEHIAEKPGEVMNWILKTVPIDAVVLDPFAGSGTTLRSAKDLGRKAIGIEIEERYCEIAARRCAQETLALETVRVAEPEQHAMEFPLTEYP